MVLSTRFEPQSNFSYFDFRFLARIEDGRRKKRWPCAATGPGEGRRREEREIRVQRCHADEEGFKAAKNASPQTANRTVQPLLLTRRRAAPSLAPMSGDSKNISCLTLPYLSP